MMGYPANGIVPAQGWYVTEVEFDVPAGGHISRTAPVIAFRVIQCPDGSNELEPIAPGFSRYGRSSDTYTYRAWHPDQEWTDSERGHGTPTADLVAYWLRRKLRKPETVTDTDSPICGRARRSGKETCRGYDPDGHGCNWHRDA